MSSLRYKLFRIGLILGLLCTPLVQAASSAQAMSESRSLNMTGLWYCPNWYASTFILVAVKKPSQEQGTISGLYLWWVVATPFLGSASGWYISNYFEFTGYQYRDTEGWSVLFRGTQINKTYAEGNFVDSEGRMGEFILVKLGT
jgi:hypothetical protein